MSMVAAYQDENSELPASSRARAAIVLIALGSAGASRVLKHFTTDEIKLLKESAAGLASITPDQIDELVDHFQEAFKKSPGLNGPGEQMTELLQNALSAEEFESIFSVDDFDGSGKEPDRETRSVWDAVANLQHEMLAPKLAREHPHVVAVLLSKIRAETAAMIAQEFEPAFRNEVMRRVLSLKSLSRPVQRLLENHLRHSYLATSDRPDQASSHTVLADIVNRMSKGHADELLEMLVVKQPKDAEKLRNLLFSFEDVVTLSKRDRMVLLDATGTEVVILALGGVDEETKEAILSCMSSRSRRMVEAELSRSDEPPPAEVDKARRQIAATGLTLWGEGKLNLHAEDEE